MKENFFNSMLMEGGKVSHKRWISVSTAAVLLWGIIYAIVNAANDNGRYNILVATGIFILIMSGVATVAQIASIVKGGPAPKEDETKPPTP
ncbi:MAG TPA: hypothetical protein PLZ45_15100 [Ferruginibacter sp.]|nr:hypothetical protein [Ferruginibacter sp.]